MPTLTFSNPQYFKHNFQVPVDSSLWNQQYKKNSNGTSPIRKAVLKINSALTPVNNSILANKLVYGIYILTFELPYKAFYVGIASGDSKKPEGILNRLRKHRIKATGSNGGNGVHHPEQWRKFAQDRFTYFHSQELADSCDDARFVIGQINENCQNKSILQFYESHIRNNSNGILDDLYKLLWGCQNNTDIMMLTSATCIPQFREDLSFKLWI